MDGKVHQILSKKIEIEKVEKDYGDLTYRIFISIMVGTIPLLLFWSFSGAIDCNNIEDEIKAEECTTTIFVFKFGVAPAMGIMMFITAFRGVLWEWKHNHSIKTDRSPLNEYEQFRSARTSDENREEQKRLIEDQENRAILRKYEAMDDL